MQMAARAVFAMAPSSPDLCYVKFFYLVALPESDAKPDTDRLKRWGRDQMGHGGP
jgi:hypothetical protein